MLCHRLLKLRHEVDTEAGWLSVPLIEPMGRIVADNLTRRGVHFHKTLA